MPIQIIFSNRGDVMHNTNGDSCSAGLGECDSDSMPKALAISRFNPTRAQLLYCGAQPAPPSLSPPAPGKCDTGLSEICSAQCRDQCCCNAKCSSRSANGKGHCDNIGTEHLCQCTYDC